MKNKVDNVYKKYSNKCFFFFTFYSLKTPKKLSWFSKKCDVARLFLTLIVIRFFSLIANQHIRMIFKGSCDTKNWINDAENHMTF